MFAAEFEPAESLGRRRSPRAPVSLDARFGKGGLGRALCKVVDVSIHGARIHTYSELRKGATIWLTFPGVGHVAADVIWSEDFVAGCQFHAPLNPTTFDGLLQRNAVPS